MERTMRMQAGYSEKQPARVITVDRANRRLECALRDGGVAYAAVWEVPIVFRWPKTGEVVMLRRDSGVWRLDSIIENTDHLESALDLADLPEGAVRLLSEKTDEGSGFYINAHQAERLFSAWVGDGVNYNFTITHGLGTENITVSLRERIRTTPLTQTAYVADTTVHVEDTTRYLSSGIAYMEDEVITYSGKTLTTLTGVTRAQEGSVAAVHLTDSLVIQPTEFLYAGPSIIDANRIRIEFDVIPDEDQYRVVVTG